MPHPVYSLHPITDQGEQYAFAMEFDEDEDEDVDIVSSPVNPLYGIPFGVCMLTARCCKTNEAVGFLTFRRDIRRDKGHILYALKIFVFMVRPEVRGQGYGSALAVGALKALQRDLEAANPDEVTVTIIGEGKSPSGAALLHRIAKNIGFIKRDFIARYNWSDFRIATNIA